eukprot:TRINITY_DN11981_c0_g1_i1.p1 TRINITY_DN11981_c0_g1~~TRINITY_DN11981_c0_g1_i1.p1  ORF type:complete len:621 (+),score=93.54 TRINITY_DN11981_c0_g1_i1:110-1972(+)
MPAASVHDSDTTLSQDNSLDQLIERGLSISSSSAFLAPARKPVSRSDRDELILRTLQGLEQGMVSLSQQVTDLEKDVRRVSFFTEQSANNTGMPFGAMPPLPSSMPSRTLRAPSHAVRKQSNTTYENPRELEKNRVRAFSEAATEEYNRHRSKTPPWMKVKRVIKKMSLSRLVEERHGVPRNPTVASTLGISNTSITSPESPKSVEEPKKQRAATRHDDDEDLADESPSRMFLPDGDFRRVWDTLYIMCLLFEVFLWSLVIFSSGSDPYDEPAIRTSPAIFVVRALVSCFWFADWYVEIRTAKLEGWAIIEAPDVLWKHFLHKRLPFDGLISLPLDLVLTLAGLDLPGYWAMSVRILRLYRVFALYRHSTPTRETPKLVESFVFGFWCLVSVQIATCLWLHFATASELDIEVDGFQCGNDDRILNCNTDYRNVNNTLSLTTLYVQSFYFTFTTLSSVGYGDISPNGNGTRMFNVLIQFLGLALIMVVSGRTGAYFITTDPYKLMLIDRKRRLEHLMANGNVPWSIQKEAFTAYPSLLDTSWKDFQYALCCCCCTFPLQVYSARAARIHPDEDQYAHQGWSHQQGAHVQRVVAPAAVALVERARGGVPRLEGALDSRGRGG